VTANPVTRDDVLAYLPDWHARGRVLPAIPVVAALLNEARKYRRYKSWMIRNMEITLAAMLEVTGSEEVPPVNQLVDQQARLHAMIGPNFMFLPGFATEQPADFYIDDRCGRTAAPKRTVYAAVKELAAHAVVHGLDPHKLPPLPQFPSCGVW
jgi:hypothetical protein